MATIYRFIVEQKTRTSGDGRKPRETTGKGAAKKGKMVSIFADTNEKGGVEHNRKMRAINPLINKMTGGAWEKGMRVGRAAVGLIKVNTETGKTGISGPAVAIIFAFVIQSLLKWQKTQQERARRMNEQNYKQLENGIGAVHSQYSISTNIFTGRQTYNQNK